VCLFVIPPYGSKGGGSLLCLFFVCFCAVTDFSAAEKDRGVKFCMRLLPFWWTLASVESRRRHYFRDELYKNRRGSVESGRRGSVGNRNWGRAEPSRKAVWWDLRLANLLTNLLFVSSLLCCMLLLFRCLEFMVLYVTLLSVAWNSWQRLWFPESSTTGVGSGSGSYLQTISISDIDRHLRPLFAVDLKHYRKYFWHFAQLDSRWTIWCQILLIVDSSSVRTDSFRSIPSELYHFLVLFLTFYSAPQCSHCKRCTSYGNSVCPSVCLPVLSVRPSHAGIVWKRRHVARCSLHCWIAKCV